MRAAVRRLAQLLVLYAIFTSFYVVEEGFAMIVERFGQFSRLCPAGLHFLVPFVDAPRPLLWRSTEVTLHSVGIGHVRQTLKISQASVNKVDLRENIMDFPSQVRQPVHGTVALVDGAWPTAPVAAAPRIAGQARGRKSRCAHLTPPLCTLL